MAIDIATRPFTESWTEDDGGVGTVVESGGAKYIKVYNAGADAIADGDVVGVFTTTIAKGHVSVTAATMLDSSDGTTTVSLVAGVAVGPIDAGSYGWLWCEGPLGEIITTDGTVEKGDPMYCADGAKVATTATNAHLHGEFGYAHAAAPPSRVQPSRAATGRTSPAPD